MAGQGNVVPYTQRKKIETSNKLPEDVVEVILSFLPYKKLCSLSILSKRYINSWKLCRNLSFDIDFARNLSRGECRNIVNKFFNNHETTCADRFQLRYDASDESNLVSWWVGKAIRLGIKELELDLTQKTRDTRLVYDLIDVESLKIMKLVNCKLELPLSSKGLPHLQEITLQNVIMDDMPPLVESIFLNCMSLRVLRLIKCNLGNTLRAYAQDLRGFETLVVKDCPDLHVTLVNSPSLQTFHYHGKITDLRFCCEMPYLDDVILHIAHPRFFKQFSNRNELLDRLAFLEILTVTTIFLEGLCARFENHAYRKMKFYLHRLKEFHLIVAPESFVNPSDVAIFIKRCPTLQKLFIDLGRDAFGSSLYWKNYGMNHLSACEATFPYMKYVKIKGFTMNELPMCMARFFLKNSINLHSLILVKARIHNFPIKYSSENIRWGIISNATIEIRNYRGDKDTVMPKYLRGV
ncbi:hypothetical protein C2S52_003344 [Perilla frutescens var. hirtella]|nr:hypothetical protein C2S52_003344 [Perilla frutescens var. hirtella]